MAKFGNTLVFAVAIFLLVIGLKMVVKVVDPYTRKVSASLADTLASV